MNNFDLCRRATILSDTVSPYQLARRLVEAEEEIKDLKKDNERLDNDIRDYEDWCNEGL